MTDEERSRPNGSTLCRACGEATDPKYYSNVRAICDLTLVLARARSDAVRLGAGYLRIAPDGTITRVHPYNVYVKEGKENDHA